MSDAAQTLLIESIEADDQSIPQPKKWRTVLAGALVILAGLANHIGLAWLHDRVPMAADPLPDPLFALIPGLILL